jgi:hypothetical protein
MKPMPLQRKQVSVPLAASQLHLGLGQVAGTLLIRIKLRPLHEGQMFCTCNQEILWCLEQGYDSSNDESKVVVER